MLSVTGLAATIPQILFAATMSLLTCFFVLVIYFRANITSEFGTIVAAEETVEVPVVPNAGSKSYAILVALYREASQVMPLVAALEALRWDHGDKHVYLVCETIDNETLGAIAKIELADGFHVVRVPAGKPQTKPRALNYCLGQVNADFLVIYDAEDRPHPDQLHEAFRMFQSSSDIVACLQAPLIIDNGRASWLTTMFALEYKTLFGGILPALSAWRAPMPLGGTSNHFRVAQLTDRAGGWDAYNVTEDADLGLRLARLGLQCGTLKLGTFEEAPALLLPWVRQRTRWLKGWMQTFLVHSREPVRVFRELGWRNFALFHLTLTGTIISTLVHPFLVGVLCYHAWFGFSPPPEATVSQHWLLGLSVFNLAAGYLTYAIMAWVIAGDDPTGPNRWWLLTLPFYWMLISIAGWRAFFQMFSRPHDWEKTPHGLSERSTPAISGSASKVSGPEPGSSIPFPGRKFSRVSRASVHKPDDLRAGRVRE